MTLTILTAATIGILGLLGLIRGVRRGLIAVAGTLLGSVLVDLWQSRWSGWLRTQAEPPMWGTFLLTGGVFLLVALLVGYGGSLLLPYDPRAKAMSLFDRLLGIFVGALNGALIVSYMLRYASENWPAGEVANLIADSLIASVLNTWLPWFIMALVLCTAVFVVLRGAMRLSRTLSRPVTPAITSGAIGGAKSSSPTPPSVTPHEIAASDRRFLEKVDEVIKK